MWEWQRQRQESYMANSGGCWLVKVYWATVWNCEVGVTEINTEELEGIHLTAHDYHIELSVFKYPAVMYQTVIKEQLEYSNVRVKIFVL